MKICSRCGKEGEFYDRESQCKACKRAYQSAYRSTHLEESRASVRRCIDKKRFGAPREELIGAKCQCGSTKRLSLHHRDGNGRGSARPNNDPSNLETLCNACHVNHHVKEWSLKHNPEYQKKVNDLWGLSLREIGRRIGVTHMTVKRIRLQSLGGR